MKYKGLLLAITTLIMLSSNILAQEPICGSVDLNEMLSELSEINKGCGVAISSYVDKLEALESCDDRNPLCKENLKNYEEIYAESRKIQAELNSFRSGNVVPEQRLWTWFIVGMLIGGVAIFFFMGKRGIRTLTTRLKGTTPVTITRSGQPFRIPTEENFYASEQARYHKEMETLMKERDTLRQQLREKERPEEEKNGP